jgi:hypothetical protein
MMRLSMQMGLMTLEAQRVVAMRVWGMGGLWNVTPDENARMVEEKTNAAAASVLAAGQAVMRGKSPAGVALAAMKPVRSKTRANAKRLAKRGPALPKTKP